jgi:hypothetical protein
MIRPPSKNVWIAYFVHSIIIFAAFLLADKLPQQDPLGFVDPSLSPANSVIGKLIKWDAHWYTYVAGHGYTSQSIVFFPLIILLIRALAYTGLSFANAGFLLCNFFALLSFWVMDCTLQLDFSEQERQQALLAYAVLPTSFFLNSIYTEPLFIVFSLSCLYFTRIDKWWYAGIAGALATLTRNMGILLLIFMLYEFLKTRKDNFYSVTKATPLLLLPIALLIFMIYNLILLGDPLAFVHSQQAWGRHYGFPWNNYLGNIPLLFSHDPSLQPGATLDSFMVILCFIALSCLTLQKRFKIPSSYLVLGWLWFIVPMISTSKGLPLFSMSRFILAIFPLYIFLAQLPKNIFRSYMTVSAITLWFCTALFLNWYWIG